MLCNCIIIKQSKILEEKRKLLCVTRIILWCVDFINNFDNAWSSIWLQTVIPCVDEVYSTFLMIICYPASYFWYWWSRKSLIGMADPIHHQYTTTSLQCEWWSGWRNVLTYMHLPCHKDDISMAVAEPAWLWDFPEARIRKETVSGLRDCAPLYK